MLLQVKDKIFEVTVPPGTLSAGRWTLRATLIQLPRTGGMARYRALSNTRIVSSRKGWRTGLRPATLGRWRYTIAGARFVREVPADGPSRHPKRKRMPKPSPTAAGGWPTDLHAEFRRQRSAETPSLRI
jgi:hypothetical protein